MPIVYRDFKSFYAGSDPATLDVYQSTEAVEAIAVGGRIYGSEIPGPVIMCGFLWLVVQVDPFEDVLVDSQESIFGQICVIPIPPEWRGNPAKVRFYPLPSIGFYEFQGWKFQNSPP